MNLRRALRAVLDRPAGWARCPECGERKMLFRFGVRNQCAECILQEFSEHGIEPESLDPMEPAPYAPGVLVWASWYGDWRKGEIVKRNSTRFTVRLHSGDTVYREPRQLELRDPIQDGKDRPGRLIGEEFLMEVHRD